MGAEAEGSGGATQLGAAASAARVAPFLKSAARWVETELERVLAAEDEAPPRLIEAMRYALLGGGKRLRPALALAVCRGLGGRDEDAVYGAMAIELVHTYSLVHDDLPCMDDDVLRRGRPTVHVAYNEATAVLVGDGLLTLAFEVLARAPEPLVGPSVRVLARTSGAAGMVGGQVLDLALEAAGERAATRAEVEHMHGKKTAALIGAAAALGAIAAGADSTVCRRAQGFGEALGLAFQATDDLLDVTGDANALGKTPGKDERLERATLVAAAGLDGARRAAEEWTQAAHAAAASLGWSAGDAAFDLVDFVLGRSA